MRQVLEQRHVLYAHIICVRHRSYKKGKHIMVNFVNLQFSLSAFNIFPLTFFYRTCLAVTTVVAKCSLYSTAFSGLRVESSPLFSSRARYVFYLDSTTKTYDVYHMEIQINDSRSISIDFQWCHFEWDS